MFAQLTKHLNPKVKDNIRKKKRDNKKKKKNQIYGRRKPHKFK